MMRRLMMCTLAATIAAATGALAQERPDAAPDLLKDPAVKAALDAAKASEAQTIEDQIRFCEIPAPSFKETTRGVELKQRVSAARSPERARRQGGQRARRSAGRGAASALRDRRAPRHRLPGRDRRAGEARRPGAARPRTSATTAAVWRCSSSIIRSTEAGERADAWHDHVRGGRRRGRPRRSARHEAAVQRHDEGADRSLRVD